MKRSTRSIIVLICLCLFLVIAPLIIAYSMGYRYDFQRNTIVATGGIYVRTFPAPDQVTIGGSTEKPGLFSNSVFVQNLLPKDQSVIIHKDGYYDYQKTLPVLEKEVTKLENVILFKKNIPLSQADITIAPIPENKQKFILKNSALYSLTSTVPLLKNVVAFKESGSTLFWLSNDGSLSEADTTLNNKKIIAKLSSKINLKSVYQLFIEGKYVFLREDKNMFWLNPATNKLDKIYSGINGVVVSPDQKQIMYWNDKIIFIGQTSSFDSTENSNNQEPDTMLYEATDSLQNIQWMNNDYIAFIDGQKLIFSETDIRGNINAIDISDQVLENVQKTDTTITSLKKAQIYFDKPTGRLYIQIEEQLFETERLI